MELPADGILINSNGVKCDESPMTGETKSMKKESYEKIIKNLNDLKKTEDYDKTNFHHYPSNIMVSGTKILDGFGLMVIISVGKNSQIGKIKSQLNQEEEITPLQLKLDKIAKDIGYFGLFSGIFIFIIIIIRSSIEFYLGYYENGSKDLVVRILLGLVIAITVLVVAIPEGLPLSVTISLAYSIKKMMNDNNLVRKLEACETMGGANIICSDKTGTLTKNEMYLTHFWNFSNNLIYDSTLEKAEPLEEFTNSDTSEILYNTVIYNSLDNPKSKTGNPTELAILKYFDLINKNVVDDRNKYKPIFTASFNSTRKRMSTIIEIDGKLYCFMKGASEIMLKTCTNILNLKDGNFSDLDENLIKKVEDSIEEMASNSLRTIGIVYKILEEMPNLENRDKNDLCEFETNDFTMLGVCGIKDVIRPEVPYAIKKCNSAGIQVKMVTGDNKITAFAIAKEVGIITEDDDYEFNNNLVIEGPEFMDMVGGLFCNSCENDHSICECVDHEKQLKEEKNKGKKVKKLVVKNLREFKEVGLNLKVLARSRPIDKLTLVTGLKQLEYVVAVTGDGTNDAPALSKADIGFAMNIAGTQIAKDASDILLLDDNFKSIVEAVKWGRNIYDNIRKFLQFQLTVNIVAVLVTIISSGISNKTIFTPVQMLWLNIIMDTFASLALATEPPHDKLLNRKPHSKNEYIINKKMMKHIFFQVIYQIGVVLLIVYYGPYFLPAFRNSSTRKNTIFVKYGEEFNINPNMNSKDYPSEHFTYNFNTFVMMQLFNFVNSRKLNDELNTFEGILKSKMFITMILLIFVLQFIFLTFAGRGVGVIQWGLSLYQWFICILFGIFGMVVNYFIKFFDEEKICIQIGNKRTKRNMLEKKSSLHIKRLNYDKHISSKRINV